MSFDINPTSKGPHVEHEPTGTRFPIAWSGGSPHLLASHRDELEMAAKLCQMPYPEKLHIKAARALAGNLKKLGHQTPEVQELVNRKVTEYELAEHRANGHKHFMAKCPECRAGATRG